MRHWLSVLNLKVITPPVLLLPYPADLQTKVEELSAIHISGTKGKGSVCAFVEAILRAHGLKTGMYTSPHLVHITERIQVNGQAISQERFADCFWRSWDAIQAGLSPQYPRPPGFFKFLTLMGLRVLLEEQVDVGVIEVGIGGRTDATNVLAGARVGGVAPIGYDHQEVLGESLAEIAFEESGIARPGLPVLTVCEQPLEALESLWRVARARGLDLRLVPPLAAYNPLPRLSLRGRHQQVNAALAIALARRFLQLEDYSQSLQLPLPPPPPAGHIPLDSRFLSALATTEVQTFSPFARFSLSLFSFTPHTRMHAHALCQIEVRFLRDISGPDDARFLWTRLGVWDSASVWTAHTRQRAWPLVESGSQRRRPNLAPQSAGCSFFPASRTAIPMLYCRHSQPLCIIEKLLSPLLSS